MAKFGQFKHQRAGDCVSNTGNGGQQFLGGRPFRRQGNSLVDLSLNSVTFLFHCLDHSRDRTLHLIGSKFLTMVFSSDQSDELATSCNEIAKP